MVHTVICTVLEGRGVVHSDNYLYKSCSQEGGAGVVHSDDYLYESWSRGCGS